MSLSLEDFRAALRTSGVLTDDALAEAETLIAAKRPADVEQLARLLVREKKLTAFQAQQIYAGRANRLLLGSYVLLDKLGQGGMGVVYKAQHQRMRRVVALKTVTRKVQESPEALQRFHREVEVAARLMHPHIVAAYDASEADGRLFLVMEYVEGSDLAEVIKKQGPLSVSKALHCILQAAAGLSYAHAQGVVHRDIKPANLLINTDGDIKILDMGLARFASAAEVSELTTTGQVMGTVDYMAPEQARDTHAADRRADIYSLGMTLWFLLTGRPAYEGETLVSRVIAHQTKEIPSLRAVRANVPEKLERAFRKMVAKQPEERYQTMDEAIAALNDCRTGDEVAPTVQFHLSEESKLGDFLHKLGPQSGGSPSGIGKGSAASAPRVPGTAPAAPPPRRLPMAKPLEETFSGKSSDTDPQTQQSLPPLPPLGATDENRPPWWRHLATLLAAGLALLVLCFLGLRALLSDPGDGRIPPVANNGSNGTGDDDIRPPGTPVLPVPAAPPLPLNYGNFSIYLDELDEDFARVFGGPLGRRGRTNLAAAAGGEQVLWNGRPADHALLTAPCRTMTFYGHGVVIYDIGGKFALFSGKAGINGVSTLAPLLGVQFTVYGDGRQLWISVPQREPGVGQDFHIDVRGVKQLRLETRPFGASPDLQAVWIEPKLSGGAGPPPALTSRLPKTRGVFLDDLVEVDCVLGYGRFGKFGASGLTPVDSPVVTAGHRRLWHALSMHPGHNQTASVRYRLQRRFATFRAEAGMNDLVPMRYGDPGVLTFRVHGDSRLLWESRPVQASGDRVPCELDVSGVDELQLSVQCVGPNYGRWAIWAEPELLPSAARPPATPPAGIQASELVLWNADNGEACSHGATRVNVSLYRGEELVHWQRAVRLESSPGRDAPTRLPLPAKAFNRLRIDVVEGESSLGCGLAEIEVLERGVNVAPRAVITASNTYPSDQLDLRFDAPAAVDGILQTETTGRGAWLLPPFQFGWIELEWRPATTENPHPVLGYPLARHPATAVPYGGHWYLHMPGRITWDDAQRRCQELGGYLACIETQPEAEFVFSLAHRTCSFLGGRKQRDGAWGWINGAPFLDGNWGIGEPNNVNGVEEYLDFYNSPGFNDAGRDSLYNRGFVCEWEQ